jgi:hypothetical protein
LANGLITPEYKEVFSVVLLCCFGAIKGPGDHIGLIHNHYFEWQLKRLYRYVPEYRVLTSK